MINNIVYSVSNRSITNSRYRTLVDWGTNGGLVGKNHKVFSKTDQDIDVQGLDNHQVTDIPIITTTKVVYT